MMKTINQKETYIDNHYVQSESVSKSIITGNLINRTEKKVTIFNQENKTNIVNHIEMTEKEKKPYVNDNNVPNNKMIERLYNDVFKKDKENPSFKLNKYVYNLSDEVFNKAVNEIKDEKKSIEYKKELYFKLKAGIIIFNFRKI